MVAALPQLSSWRGSLKIVHQTGERDHAEVEQAYRSAGWLDAEIVPFINDMAAAYTQATLIVCRAGATTLAELTVCGRPAILIPFPHSAGGHQVMNAQAMAAKGAALMMLEADLTADRLARLIGSLLHDRVSLLSMAAAARGLARRGAAGRLLQESRSVLAEAQ
jgi:UDP-N-acetylglucosamine--N-acetylmuramyl-(pentapeptide) pyrophosphoryl-undecaprenol N-acetylglucosamine transferase